MVEARSRSFDSVCAIFEVIDELKKYAIIFAKALLRSIFLPLKVSIQTSPRQQFVRTARKR